jgi:putative protease
MAKDNLIGIVVHWYDKISVAVIELSKNLKVGDKVKIKHGDTEFEETISSMQLDHESVKSGKKGQGIAVKFSQKAGEGSKIYMAE